MDKKTIWIIIVAVVLIIIGIAIWQSVEKPPVPINTNTATRNELATGEAVNETIVEYGPNGFNPQNITVKRGDTVTFINQSANQMWVASAPHPQHTDYPEFDELTSVGMGGVYKFTFDKAGNWKYHNHENARHFGSVVVTQ